MLAMTLGQRTAVFALGIITLSLGVFAFAFGVQQAHVGEWSFAAIAALIGLFAVHCSRDMLVGKRV